MSPYKEPSQHAHFRFLNLYTPIQVNLQFQHLDSGLNNMIKQVNTHKKSLSQ